MMASCVLACVVVCFGCLTCSFNRNSVEINQCHRNSCVKNEKRNNSSSFVSLRFDMMLVSVQLGCYLSRLHTYCSWHLKSRRYFQV